VYWLSAGWMNLRRMVRKGGGSFDYATILFTPLNVIYFRFSLRGSESISEPDHQFSHYQFSELNFKTE